METSSWDYWVEQELSRLVSLKLIRSLRPIHLSHNHKPTSIEPNNAHNLDEYQVFDELREWDRASVEVEIAESTFQRWVQDIPSSGKIHLSPILSMLKLFLDGLLKFSGLILRFK